MQEPSASQRRPRPCCLAGFVFGQLGHAPGPGDIVDHDGMQFEVLEVEGSRIDRLAVRFERRDTGER
jgi:CBS domain containing-hemolysin-like protein